MLVSAIKPKEQSWLSWFFRGLLILGFAIIIARLIELQVIKGSYFRSLAEGNRVRIVPIVAPRGRILDKDGVILVDNEPVKKTVKFEPLEGYSKVAADENVPEDEIITEWKRKYVYGADFAHITGYLGEANADEVNRVDPRCLNKGPRRLGSYVGRGGLEQFYDCKLRGIDGEEMVEVDTFGNRVRTLGRRAPIPGEEVQTNIDFKIQKKLAEAMSGLAGAAVVTLPTGEVRALYSSPSFDPNQSISKYLNDKNLPMFNRAIGGTYHPGSIFKIVTTVAAVEEAKIDADFTYEDKGVIKIDDYEYKNWYFTQYGATEGIVDAVRAMARSTDTFYYKIGEMTGADKLSSWSRKFGLASSTGIDLPGEVNGLVPSPEWKKAVKGEKWFLGNTYHFAIGQGDLAVTPVANHRLSMSVANEGFLCELKISGTPSCALLGVSSKALGLVKKGLKAACDPSGTGYPFFDFTPEVACKTGTAETSIEGETHAWFSVFAPLESPQYVVTILVEKGGEGSRVAAPIAKKIMDYIFHP